jgi:hypothetical protein
MKATLKVLPFESRHLERECPLRYDAGLQEIVAAALKTASITERKSWRSAARTYSR